MQPLGHNKLTYIHTDRQTDSQRSDRIERSVLQMVAQSVIRMEYTANSIWILKAKFHYAIWYGAGSNQIA